MENFGQHLQFVYSVHCDLHCIKLELVLAQAAPIPPIGTSTCVSLVPRPHPVLCEIKSGRGLGMRLIKKVTFLVCLSVLHSVDLYTLHPIATQCTCWQASTKH